jgi:hypothetical protein
MAGRRLTGAEAADSRGRWSSVAGAVPPPLDSEVPPPLDPEVPAPPLGTMPEVGFAESSRSAGSKSIASAEEGAGEGK